MLVYMSNSVKNVFIVNMRHMGNGVCSVKHFLEVLFVCEVSFCFASVASQAESLLRFTLGTLGQRLFRLFHISLDHKSSQPGDHTIPVEIRDMCLNFVFAR